MRITEYFGGEPNPDNSERERAALLLRADELLGKAVRRQSELATISTRRREDSSMEDSNRLANQLQSIEKYLKTDRENLSMPELQRMVDDLQRVVINLEMHIESYHKEI